MIIESQFQPPWWLTSAHAQTLYPVFRRMRTPLKIEEERLELPDGDFIDLAWMKQKPNPEAPIVIVLHGLGGGVQSPYVPYLLKAFKSHGFRPVLMHFRGASATPNRFTRAYHSGDTNDFHYFLQTLHEREPKTPKLAVGISLGGNVLLKWLGEQGKQNLLQGAVAVSVPFELGKVASCINQGFARLYQRYLLNQLKAIFLRKMLKDEKNYPFSKQELLGANTFRDFDGLVTAPLHGFKSADDYYQKASSRAYLPAIKTPTLIIHAKDDPFMDPSVIPHPNELSKDTDLEICSHGGHVGFIMAKSSRKMGRFWLGIRILEFLGQIVKPTTQSQDKHF